MRISALLIVVLLLAHGPAGSLDAQCEPTIDCNVNGVLDSCDLTLGTSDDCNGNGIPDECDISGGIPDCNFNGVPDSCEPALPFVVTPTAGLAAASSVDLDGITMVVGSAADNSGAPNGGAAHVFRRVGTQWIEDGSELISADIAAADEFGFAVAVDGDQIAIGAPGASVGSAQDAGAVYIFRRLSGTWTQVARLTLSIFSAGDRFGGSVAIHGNRVIAGAIGNGAGQASIFTFDGFGWSEVASLGPPGPVVGDAFGTAVGISNARAYIGAPGRTVGITPNAGEMFTYEFAGSWIFDTSLTATPPESGSGFGSTLAGIDVSLAIGAPSQGSGVGAVHLFEQVTNVWTFDQVITTPSTPASQGFGTDLSMSNKYLLVGELETVAPATVGRAHAYRRQPGAWGYESTIEAVAVGDDFGRSVGTDGIYGALGAPGVPEATVHWLEPVPDCNGNLIDDRCDISQGVSLDCNGNGVPDDCELAAGTSLDCNGNLIPDECDISSGASIDCNLNGIPDSCDLSSGSSLDCNLNAIPDGCDISSGIETDCNLNGIPDSCDGITDSTPPMITGVPTNFAVSTDLGICGAVVNWVEPNITDNCAIATIDATHSPGDTFPLGSTTVTYTAFDTSGNSASAGFTVTVVDNVSPVFSGTPADFTVENDPGVCSAQVSWIPPVASDGCGVVSLTSNFSSGATLPVGITLVVYTAVDVNGNMSSTSFSVEVQDLTSPTIVGLPSDISVSAGLGFCGASVTWAGPGVIDNCQIQSLTSNFSSGDIFPLGTSTVTYTATDASGNSAQGGFQVTVVDDVPPVITGMPSDLNIFLAPGICSTPAFWTPPNASDNCTISSFTSTLSPGALVSAGITVVEYTATDVNGNSTIDSFQITVIDQEDPVFVSAPGDIAAGTDAGLCTASVFWVAPVATDNCSVASLGGDATPGDPFPLGTTLVTYTAVDASGNFATTSFSVTVTDTEFPAIPDLPADQVVGTDPGSCGAVINWAEPAGQDNCIVVSISGDHAPGETFLPGDTVVTYTITDGVGNTTNQSFTITVVDAEDPQIIGLPTGLNVNNDPGSCGAAVVWSLPTISDNCGILSQSSTHLPGDFFPVGATDVVYTATDVNGRVTTVTVPVIVTDAELPEIVGVPANITVPNQPSTCFALVNWTEPTASDNCGLTSFVSNFTPGSPFPAGSTQVMYIATDVNGGVFQAAFTIIVVDTEFPSVVASGDITVSALPGECTAAVSVPAPLIGDNCVVLVVSNDFNGGPDASDIYPVGTTTVIWTVVDENGNVSSASQDVTVEISGGGTDCNSNGLPDSCDLALGTSFDCNGNGIPDECDIASGVSIDTNGNLVPDECDVSFRRGDANDDGTYNIADGIFVLQNLFVAGPVPACDDAADSNDDGFLDVSDVIFTINYIFLGGPPPPPPFAVCGIDPTGADFVGCNSNSSCP